MTDPLHTEPVVVVTPNDSMCGGLYPVHGSVTHGRTVECCDFCGLPADYEPARTAAEAASRARIKKLEAECFMLAAVSCINPGQHGLVGDEHGNSICTAHDALLAEEKAHSEALADLAASRAREDALVSLLTKAVGDIAAALEAAGSAGLIRKWTADYVAAINAHDARAALNPAAKGGE